MTQLTPATASPFDALRREDETGEFWSARDLMKPLGYVEWRKFEGAIERAKVSACNSGHDCDVMFQGGVYFGGADKVSKGPAPADYRLTRMAAYLLTMNGDPRKTEIAEAQAYFAIKTREAELAAAKPPTEIEIARQYLASLEALEAAKAIAAEATADLQAFHASPEWLSVGQFANTLGIGRTKLFGMLRDAGVVFKDQQQGGHRVYQTYIDAGWADARWEMWPNGAGFAWTPYLTRKGVTEIRKMLGR